MRADRMVAIALLLQAHRRLTVPRLARLLEVSERTVRRDIAGLLDAGLPIYAERGRGGGWVLAEGYKVDLSALTAEEAQALFLVAGPELLAGLGIERGVTSALRKMLAALPDETRQEATKARRAIHIDTTRWGEVAEETPHAVSELRTAVFAGVQVDLRYAKSGGAATTRRVQPYGLVSKVGVWYLLAGTSAGLRTFRVSRVVAVTPTAEPVERPRDFDLVKAWSEATSGLPDWPSSSRVPVELAAAADAGPAVVEWLGQAYRPRRLDGRSADPARPLRYAAVFPDVDDAAFTLLCLGDRIRVLEPPAVRARLAAIGRDLVAAYPTSPPPSSLPEL